ncbi:hypothetical protein AURDEDRAFT_175425 [Auricularia subglabra TFB-10046 SS5]|uniref:BTB domain-containing protein n=1 Tax=Auricularia subglabra (strain TFB-10046 / SS5) TaxID=717982 RepID=J0WRW8_AURST|nr:hypothetical protein AURDEDRAFT_175425 [Auricularia subglabra TFB-10046 SS5]
MADRNPQGEVAPSRHGEFWFPDGSIVLGVENVLFKVHRSVLARQSELFEGMFESGTPGKDGEGCEALPLVLPDIGSKPFADLLSIIYGPRGGTVPTGKAADLIALIRLAHRLQFTEAFDIIVRAAHDTLSPLERLGLGLDYDIGDWAYAAFAELVLEFGPEPRALHGLITHETHVNILVARQRVSDARSLFIILHSRGGDDARVHAYAAHVVPRTKRELFESAARTLASQPGQPIRYGPNPSQTVLESWAPHRTVEEQIIRDAWRTLQKGPG